LFSNIIIVNCNLNHKALGSSDKIYGNSFPKEMCNKGKAVAGWVIPGCSGGQRGFIRGTSQKLDREDGAGAKWLQNLGWYFTRIWENLKKW
jgi:hypothetical protein